MFTFKQTTLFTMLLTIFYAHSILPMEQLIKEEHLRKKQELLEGLRRNLPTTIANFFDQIKATEDHSKSEYMQTCLQLSKDIELMLYYLPNQEREILDFEMPENVDHYELPEPTPKKLKEWFTKSIQIIIANLIDNRKNHADNLWRFKRCNKDILKLMEQSRYPGKGKRFKKATPSFGSSTDYF